MKKIGADKMIDSPKITHECPKCLRNMVSTPDKMWVDLSYANELGVVTAAVFVDATCLCGNDYTTRLI